MTEQTASDGAQKETDEELYRLSVGGDDGALKELLLRYDESLTLFIFQIVGNYLDAEELELDTFAAAITGRSRFCGKSSFKTWLYAIGRKLAMKSLRKNRPILRDSEDQKAFTYKGQGGASAEIPPDFRLLQMERRRELFDAMKELNAEYRETLFLTYFEEMNRGEVAAAMGKSEKQVSDLLYRGKNALKTVLEKKGIHDAYSG